MHSAGAGQGRKYENGKYIIREGCMTWQDTYVRRECDSRQCQEHMTDNQVLCFALFCFFVVVVVVVVVS